MILKIQDSGDCNLLVKMGKATMYCDETEISDELLKVGSKKMIVR